MTETTWYAWVRGYDAVAELVDAIAAAGLNAVSYALGQRAATRGRPQ